jgi:hypothetical protein
VIVPGTQIILPAFIVPPAPTRQSRAWLLSHVTIRLTDGIFAVRVFRGPNADALEIDAHPGLLGHWFAVGDYVHSYARALGSLDASAAMNESDLMYLHSGSTLNVGLCSPALRPEGHGEQVEFVAGTPPRLEPLKDYFARFAAR